MTSDTHFFNENILRYENRPYENVQQMNSALTLNWNNLVSCEDLVYVLGNFGNACPEDLKRLYQELNGRITLIRSKAEDPLYSLIDVGFDSLADQVGLKYKHWNFVMTHAPLEEPFYDDTSHPFINLHGHIHGKNRAYLNRVNVSCNAWNFAPVNLEEVIVEYKKERTKYELHDQSSI